MQRRLALLSLLCALGCTREERAAEPTRIVAPPATQTTPPPPTPAPAVPPTRLRALRADGTPAAGVRVELLPSAADRLQPDTTLATAETDAAGAAELVLPGARAEFLRLRLTAADAPALERAIAPRDAALALELRLPADAAGEPALGTPPGSATAALWAAQAIAATWTKDQVGRLEPPTPAEREAACTRAAASAAREPPEVAAPLRLLHLQFAIAHGCGLAARDVLAAMTAIGPAEPLWALDPGALEASLNVLAQDGGDAAARDAFVEQVIADHGSALLVGELLFKRLLETEDEQLARRTVAALRAPRFAGTVAATAARGFDPDHLRPGSEIPAFAAVTVDGAAISRESLRGRPYVLDFWGTWCAGCIDEMPALHAAFAAASGVARPPRSAAAWRTWEPPAGPAPVTFISVAAHDTADKVAEFRRDEWPLPWLNVIADDAPGSILQALEIRRFPTAVFVDARGVIVQKDGDPVAGARKLLAAPPAN